MCFNLNAYIPLFIGVHHACVSIATAYIVPHEQIAVSIFSPIFFSHHVGLTLNQCPTCLQESIITIVVISIILSEFQRFIGILFSLDFLFDGLYFSFEEGEGVIVFGAIEGFTIHNSKQHPLWDFAIEDIIFLEPYLGV